MQVSLPASVFSPRLPPLWLPTSGSGAYELGPNDGGIKRGDRESTGDLEADVEDTVGPDGSGTMGEDNSPSTGDPSGLGGGGYDGLGDADDTIGSGSEHTGGIDDLTILDAEDPNLGLTNIGDIGPDDWAADTGPTRTPESETGAATDGLADYSSTLTGGHEGDRAGARRDRNTDGSADDRGTTGS